MGEDTEGGPSFHFMTNVGSLDEASGLLAAMANPRRLHMLSLLTQEEMSVGQLTTLVELDQSATSQHLAKLRAVGLVERRREAQQIFYMCRTEKVKRLLDVLHSLGLPP